MLAGVRPAGALRRIALQLSKARESLPHRPLQVLPEQRAVDIALVPSIIGSGTIAAVSADSPDTDGVYQGSTAWSGTRRPGVEGSAWEV
jgi:hypothetical protein